MVHSLDKQQGNVMNLPFSPTHNDKTTQGSSLKTEFASLICLLRVRESHLVPELTKTKI